MQTAFAQSAKFRECLGFFPVDGTPLNQFPQGRFTASQRTGGLGVVYEPRRYAPRLSASYAYVRHTDMGSRKFCVVLPSTRILPPPELLATRSGKCYSVEVLSSNSTYTVKAEIIEPNLFRRVKHTISPPYLGWLQSRK